MQNSRDLCKIPGIQDFFGIFNLRDFPEIRNRAFCGMGYLEKKPTLLIRNFQKSELWNMNPAYGKDNFLLYDLLDSKFHDEGSLTGELAKCARDSSNFEEVGVLDSSFRLADYELGSLCYNLSVDLKKIYKEKHYKISRVRIKL